MSENDLTSYRTKLDDQIEKTDSEIDTSLTYISIGALGFFLTINEKFLRLSESNWKCLLIISVFLLLLSFILILIKKYGISKYAKKIIANIDDKKPNEDIIKPWKDSEKFFGNINKLAYLSLGFGVLFQVIFFLINISNKGKLPVQDKPLIKYEIILQDHRQIDSLKSLGDTIYIYEIKR